MLIRTVMMSLSLALGANSLWAPTVASMESRDATIQ